MCDVYALAVDGFLPSLRSLRVRIREDDITTVSGPLPPATSLRMPQLETLDLYLKRLEEKVEWKCVEALTSDSVMPRLRHCTLVYNLSMSTEIIDIFASPLFDNDERHVRVRFALHLDRSVTIDPSHISDISKVRSGRYNEIYVEYVSIYLIWLRTLTL
jgi:hypothetical protein